jgi:HSP20 family protein
MANESTGGGTNEPGGKGQQEAKGSERQARAAGGPSQQQRAEREGRETSRGLSRREWLQPGALAIPGFATSPFSLMRRMMDDLDRVFEEFGFRTGESSMARRELQRRAAGREAFWAPDVDVFEREGKLVVRADLPGLSKDDVRVEVQDGALVIEGERRHEREIERGGMYRAERIYGTFSRVIPLPEGVDPDAAEARFDNGVLEVSLGLSEEKARGKRIEIREGKQAGQGGKQGAVH